MAEPDSRQPYVNGHGNYQKTMPVNGTTTCSSLTDDSANESSSRRSSENSLRDLPAIPVNGELPPPLPSHPPRNDKLPPRLKARQSPAPKFIPEKEITIPADGNISGFSVEDMTTFFKHMGMSDRIVNHLNKKGLDGKKFSKLRDSDLETIGIDNPIVFHFRDKSRGKNSKRVPFML